MKKTYEKPMAEKIQFDYTAQVVAASGNNDWGVDPIQPGHMRNMFDSARACQAFNYVGCTYYNVQ